MKNKSDKLKYECESPNSKTSKVVAAINDILSPYFDSKEEREFVLNRLWLTHNFLEIAKIILDE